MLRPRLLGRVVKLGLGPFEGLVDVLVLPRHGGGGPGIPVSRQGLGNSVESFVRGGLTLIQVARKPIEIRRRIRACRELRLQIRHGGAICRDQAQGLRRLSPCDQPLSLNQSTVRKKQT